VLGFLVGWFEFLASAPGGGKFRPQKPTGRAVAVRVDHGHLPAGHRQPRRAIVLVGNLIMAGGILMAAQWRKHWLTKAGLLLGLAGVVGGGALLGWQTLAPRMEMLPEGYASAKEFFLAGHYMARDNAWFGTGPGTFETMYQLYRRNGSDFWLPRCTTTGWKRLITFGRVGAAPIFLTLLLVLAHWFRAAAFMGTSILSCCSGWPSAAA